MAYKNRKKYLEAQRRYNEAHRVERRILARKWRENNKEKKKAYDSAYKKEYYKTYNKRPLSILKHSCRKKTRYAVKTGKIIKGTCAVCNATKVEAHHTDYSNHLNVTWLCKKHHMETHYPLIVCTYGV